MSVKTLRKLCHKVNRKIIPAIFKILLKIVAYNKELQRVLQKPLSFNKSFCADVWI